MIETTSKKYLLFLSLPLAVSGQYLLSRFDQPATLGPGLLLYALAVGCFLFSTWNQNEPSLFEQKITPRVEWIVLSLILLLAAVLRLYRLDAIPPGIYLDSSAQAVAALRILHEHWHPPFILPILNTPSPIVYLLAFWLCWLTPDQAHLYEFMALFSLAALPLIYWFFRQLTGSVAALMTLYFLVVMRWHLIFSRNGMFNAQTIFFAFGALAFLIHALRSQKKWAFVLSAVLLAGGFYTYQAYKIFPLLVLVGLVYEYRKDSSVIRSNWRILLASVALAVVLAWPVVHSWVEQKTLGIRESQLFIGKDIAEQKSLMPLVNKAAQTALLFNRKGGTEPRHNYQNHRMLDDVTGIFFVLGFFYALVRARQRAFFYAIGGFAILSLPELMVDLSPEIHRLLCVIPFCAFFAATGFVVVAKETGEFFKGKRVVKGLLLGVLLLAGALNVKNYFIDQAGDDRFWKSNDIEASTVGRQVVQEPDILHYLAPNFFSHPTVQYLTYNIQNQSVRKMDLNATSGEAVANGKKVCFVLGEGKGPTLLYLKKLYSGGKEEVFQGRLGENLAYFYYPPTPFHSVPITRGLRGDYFSNSSLSGAPLFSRLDPLINFTHLADFGMNSPQVGVRWEGKLDVPISGSYEFFILTSEQGEFWLDGKEVVDTLKQTRNSLILEKGLHPIQVICRRETNPYIQMDFHLLWKIPGQIQYEVVPNTFFGPTISRH